MDTRWTKHLTGDAKKNFEQLLHNSQQALGRLLDIVSEEEASLARIEATPGDFSNPNWAYLQAFRNGKRSGFKEVKDLLDFIRRKS